MLLPLLAAASGLALAAAPGCTGLIGGANPGQGGAGAGSGGGGGAGGANPEAMFDALLPELQAQCDACHGTGKQVPFLADPAYITVTSWPGGGAAPTLVTRDHTQSLFLTHATTAAHTGGAFAGPLLEQVTAWLQVEAENMDPIMPPPPGVLRIGPFPISPAPLNIHYFDDYMGDAYFGVALSFLHSENMGTLTLTGLQITTTEAIGLNFTNPEVQVFAAGADTGTPIATQPFPTFSANIPTRETLPFPADVVIPNWTAGMEVAIQFDTLAPNSDAGGQPCNALQSFTDNAQTPLTTSCATAACHGANTTTAGQIMFLNAADSAAFCQSVKARVNLADPPNSQIFLNSVPMGASTHSFEFADQASFDAFSTAVTTWISVETP